MQIGIEYGIMQACAEGFDVLRNKDSRALAEAERFSLDMGDIAEIWRRDSVRGRSIIPTVILHDPWYARGLAGGARENKRIPRGEAISMSHDLSALA